MRSTSPHEGLTGESGPERGESGQTMQAAGGDHGRGSGIDFGALDGAEPTGDLAEDHGRAECALASVVDTGHVTAGDEAEEVIPVQARGAEKTPGSRIGGGGACQQPLQVGMVSRQGAVLQDFSPRADRHIPSQQDTRTQGKALIPFLNRMVCIAQQMRQAHLAGCTMAQLAAMADRPSRPPDARRPEFDAGRAGIGIRWQTAVEPSRTHCHQVLPFTRTEISSPLTTELARTAATTGAVAASSGAVARARTLVIAPSLRVRPNTSASSRARRSKPIA